MKKIFLLIVGILSSGVFTLKSTSYAGKDLELHSFKNANLEGENFTKAFLLEAKFENANLAHTNFSHANLQASNFSNATLMNANLTNANLMAANLKKANLMNANLTNTNFAEANLLGANLHGANLTGTNFWAVRGLTEWSQIKGSKIKGATLPSKMDFSGADFSAKNLAKTQFPSANLTGVNFSGANLTGASVSGANTKNTNFAQSNLAGANLSSTSFNGNNFSKVNLAGANLEKADFNGIDFSGVNFTGVKVAGATFTNCKLLGSKGLLLSAIYSKNNVLIKVVLDAGYIITKSSILKIQTFLSDKKKRAALSASLSDVNKKVDPLQKQYNTAFVQYNDISKKQMNKLFVVMEKLHTLNETLLPLKKEKQKLESQLEALNAQNPFTQYLSGVGQKLMSALLNKKSATVILLINQVQQITSEQMEQFFQLTHPLLYTQNQMSPLLIAVKLNLPSATKELLEGLKISTGSSVTKTYINTFTGDGPPGVVSTNAFGWAFYNLRSLNNSQAAAQIIQALINAGATIPSNPIIKARLRSAKVKF